MPKTDQLKLHICGMRPLFMLLLITLIVLITSLPTNAAPQRKDARCPSQPEIDPCSCRQRAASLYLACRNINTKRLIDVLEALKKESYLINTMKITDSDLFSIPDDAFVGLQVEELIIINSKVSTLEKTAFTALGESLRELVLASNQIMEVPTDSFSHLNSLKVLDLSNNKMEQLKYGAFSGMESLEELHFEGNDIVHVDSLAFNGCCRDLLVLNMANNLLTTIPSEAFTPLTNLSLLKLHDNNIKDVKKGAFNGLNQLNTLDLSNNQISTIEAEAFGSSSIHSLVLKNNNIANLSDMTFVGLESTTEWLDLSYNEFDSVPSEALSVFKILRHLDLSHNRITNLQEDSLTSFSEHLRYIELNNNTLQHISPMAFQDLGSVEFLMLGHNNLTRMTNDTVQSILDTIFMLDLSDNPLVCGCELQWLQNWLATVNPLDRLTPDPTCCIQGTRQRQFVRQLTCDQQDEISSASDDLRMCLDLECVKSLASFFSKRISWY